MSVYATGLSDSQVAEGDLSRLAEENLRLKLKVAQVEEQLFYMQADALTTEVEAVHAASAKTKGLESQITFKDQEIQRLKHELLALTKKEISSRVNQKADTPGAAVTGCVSYVAPSVSKTDATGLYVNPSLDTKTMNTLPSDGEGGSLPPRARVPTVVSSEKVAGSGERDHLFNATKLLQPTPCSCVDYCLFVRNLLPLCQQINGNLTRIFCNEVIRDINCYSGPMNLRDNLQLTSRTPAAQSSADRGAKTMSTRSAASEGLTALYNTPNCAHQPQNVDTGSGSTKVQTATALRGMDVSSSITHLVNNMNDLIRTSSASQLTVMGVVRCIKSLSFVCTVELLPLWHSNFRNFVKKKDTADVRQRSAILSKIEETILDSLKLVELCISVYRSVLWAEYEVAFCNYCQAFQKNCISSDFERSTGRNISVDTQRNCSDNDENTESIKIITPNGGRLAHPSSFGGSICTKRRFSGDESPLAKKLFRPENLTQCSNVSAQDDNGEAEEATVPWRFHRDMSCRETVALSFATDLESNGDMRQVIDNISGRLILVEPSKLRFSGQPTTWTGLTGGSSEAPSWHTQSIIRLTHRLNAVAKHLSCRRSDVCAASLDNLMDMGADTTDVSLDVALMTRAICAFIQRHRYSMHCRSTQFTQRNWGAAFENEICQVVWGLFRSSSHTAIATPAANAALFKLSSLNAECAVTNSSNTATNTSTATGIRNYEDPCFSDAAVVKRYSLNSTQHNAVGKGARSLHSSLAFSTNSSNILSLLAAGGLSWANRFSLLRTLTDVVAHDRAAFEALLDVHGCIEGYTTDCIDYKTIYSTTANNSGQVFRKAEPPSSGNYIGSAWNDRQAAHSEIGVGPVGSKDIGKVNYTKWPSLISVFLRYFWSIDLNEASTSAVHSNIDFKCTIDNPGSCHLLMITFLVRILECYGSSAVPIVLGIDTKSVRETSKTDPFCPPVPGKGVLFDSPSRHVPNRSPRPLKRTSGHNKIESNGEKVSKAGKIPMSPLLLEPAVAVKKSRSSIIGSDPPMRSNSFDEFSTEHNNKSSKFNVDNFLNVMNLDVFTLFMRTWIDGIAALDSAPPSLEPGSYYYFVSRICLEIPKLFELLARHTCPSLKEFSRRSGIYGEMQCAVYKVWTNRTHPSLKFSRGQAGFLGSLFS